MRCLNVFAVVWVAVAVNQKQIEEAAVGDWQRIDGRQRG